MQSSNNNFEPTPSPQMNPMLSNQQESVVFDTPGNEFALSMAGTFNQQMHNIGFYGGNVQNQFGEEFLAPMGYYTPPCNPQYMSQFSPCFSPMFQPFLSLPNSANLHPMDATSQNLICAFPSEGDLMLPQSLQAPGGPFDTFSLDPTPVGNYTNFASDFKPVILVDSSAAKEKAEPVATVTSILAPKRDSKIATPLALINDTNDSATSNKSSVSSACLLPSKESQKRIHNQEIEAEKTLAELSAKHLLEKSNYSHIADGSSSQVGLQYDTNFEQQIKRKRQHHQKSEQQRRAAMAIKFKELAALIPEVKRKAYPNAPLLSQSEILSATISNVDDQKKQYELQSKILHFLRHRFSVPDASKQFPLLPNSLPQVLPDESLLSDSENP